MHKPLFSILTGVTLVLAGCSDSTEVKKDPAGLEAAFQGAPADQTVEAPPIEEGTTTDAIHIPANNEPHAVPVQQMAGQAAAALRQDDLTQAAILLQTLRRAQNLSPQQLTAVQDQMSAFQSELANRAEGGDEKAKRALALLMQNTRW